MISPAAEQCAVDHDRIEEIEFLLGRVAPLLGQLRTTYARLMAEGAEAEDEVAFGRLLAARERLQEAIGEAILVHVASGGRVRIGS